MNISFQLLLFCILIQKCHLFYIKHIISPRFIREKLSYDDSNTVNIQALVENGVQYAKNIAISPDLGSKIHGCTSNVILQTDVLKDNVVMKAISDSKVVQGILALLAKVGLYCYY